MNYLQLIQRGTMYAEDTCTNWSRRRSRLIKVWFERDKCPRLFAILRTLDDRLSEVRKCYAELRAQARVRAYEAGQQLVLLECPGWECSMSMEGVGVAVRARDYEPGALCCGICGTPLTTREEQAAVDALAEMGIFTR